MIVSVSPTESPLLNNIQPDFPSHHPPQAITGGNTSVSPDTEEALIQTPLQPGKTLIIYHPHAQHPPEVIDTDTLSLTRELPPSLPPSEPWAPFSSRGDFEQAELFIKHNCTNGLINDQLRLNQKQDSSNHGQSNPPSMKNAREMHKILEEARSNLDISSVCWIHSNTIQTAEEN